MLDAINNLSQEDFDNLIRCVDTDDKAGLLACMKVYCHVVEDTVVTKLHTTAPKKKLQLLDTAVLVYNFRYKSHSESILDFKKNLIFVRSRTSSTQVVMSYYNYQNKVIDIPEFWSGDKWFKQLTKMAKEYARRLYADVVKTKEKKWISDLNLLKTPYLCYCVLIRYTDPAGNIQHQIYIGEQGEPNRWKLSGTQHFRMIKLALEGKMHQRQACDLALAYFG